MKKIFFNSLVLLLLSSGCNLKDNSIIEAPIAPNISRISVFPNQISVDKISPAVNPEDVVDTTIIVSGAVNDLNNDITSLTFTIISPNGGSLSSDNVLLDNGVYPDTTADDGIFTGRSTISFKKKELGSYTVQLSVKDLSEFNTITLSTIEVINPLAKIPQVSNIVAPDTAFILPGNDSVLAHFTVRATDPQGLEDIKNVTATITSADGEYSFSAQMFDDGGLFPIPPDNISSGDVSAGDSIFSVQIPLRKKHVANYIVQVVATDKDDAVSSSIFRTFSVRNQFNNPPALSNLVMPDSVNVPREIDTNFVKITLKVEDPQGIEDIKSTYFTSKRPDGSIVGTYEMFDDGNAKFYETFGGFFTSGDNTAGDGTFTVTVPIPQGTTIGTYRDFTFQARDRAGEVSATITKRIYLR